MRKFDLKIFLKQLVPAGFPLAFFMSGKENKPYPRLNNSMRIINTSGKNPVRTYLSLDKEINVILADNKGQSGVYRWVHIESGKNYIGSSANLSDRFRRYFNYSYLSSSRRGASLICKALLKYGYAGFRLEILEYCSNTEVLAREQFYLDKFKPEYNILKIAGSNLGYKHSVASLKLMSVASRSRNQLEDFLKSKRESMLGRELYKTHLENMALNNSFRQAVVLHNSTTGDSQQYTSMTQAALFLGVHMTTVKRYLNSSKLCKGYAITKVNSGLDLPSGSGPTNERQAVLLTNKASGVTQEFSTIKAACQYLEISSKRLSNYFKNNESSNTNGEISTIKGYIISKIDTLDGVKGNSKAIEVINVDTNEVTRYSSVSSAAEALNIPQSSISTYFNRKRTTPYRNKYLFKFI
uniref:GIY-YIG endonuclease n=1 Tax=Cryphonectria parasitica TaxID=5116 RepID=A0A191MXF9_CRYPA|nr:GIY-YIG endonuclease [Cryphonectria parasitica]